MDYKFYLLIILGLFGLFLLGHSITGFVVSDACEGSCSEERFSLSDHSPEIGLVGLAVFGWSFARLVRS